MTTHSPGDILLMDYPYTSGGQSKTRPALVIYDRGDADLFVARITSQPPRSPTDVVLADWRSTGLLAPSITRLDKLATLEKSLIKRAVGKLSLQDRASVATVLHKMFANW